MTLIANVNLAWLNKFPPDHLYYSLIKFWFLREKSKFDILFLFGMTAVEY